MLEIIVPKIDREQQSSFEMYVEVQPRASAVRTIGVLVTDVDDNPPTIQFNHNKSVEVTVPLNATSVVVTNVKISDPDLVKVLIKSVTWY